MAGAMIGSDALSGAMIGPPTPPPTGPPDGGTDGSGFCCDEFDTGVDDGGAVCAPAAGPGGGP